mgnify:CR=1 FL=1
MQYVPGQLGPLVLPSKRAAEVRRVTFNFAPYLKGEALDAVELVDIDEGLTVTELDSTIDSQSIRIEGGLEGTRYRFTSRAIVSSGEVLEVRAEQRVIGDL